MFARAENRQAAICTVIAAQPLPGSRLLHGIAVSRKYMQRVRCSRLPAVVAMLRSCTDAPLRIASRQNVVVLADERMMGQIGIAHHCTNRQAAIWQMPRSCRAADGLCRSSCLRRLDVELHQIDQRRPAGDEANVCALLRCLRFCRRGDRLGVIVGAREIERFSSPFSRACRFAAQL